MQRYSIRCTLLRLRLVVMAQNEIDALNYARDYYRLPDHKYLKIRKSSKHQKLNMIKNDGGRQNAGSNEKLDCTVRALSIALNMSYTSTHSLLAAYGRKDRHRYDFHRFMDHDMGKWLAERYITNCSTLGQFVRTYPTGTFICAIRGHVLTVIDGVIHDTGMNGGKSKLLQVWTPIAY